MALWSDGQPFRAPFSNPDGSGLAWTNMPAADTEIYGNLVRRQLIGAELFTRARIVLALTAAATATAQLRLQYSLDGSAWADAGATPIELLLGTAGGLRWGSWGTLVPAARADALWRLLGSGGDGVVDPAMRGIAVEYQ